MKSLEVSAVLVSHFHRSTIERALRSLRLLGDDLVEVLVVDNGGGLGVGLDESIVGRSLRLISPGENLGFAGGVNRAAQAAAGQMLLLLSPDAEILSWDPKPLHEVFASQMVGAVGALTLDLDDRPSVSWGEFPGIRRLLGQLTLSRWYRDRKRLNDLGRGQPVVVQWALGAALLIPRRHFFDVGPFDESYFVCGEDQDFGGRLATRGLQCIVSPAWTVRHVPKDPGGIRREIRSNDLRFVRRYGNPAGRLIWSVLGFGLRDGAAIQETLRTAPSDVAEPAQNTSGPSLEIVGPCEGRPDPDSVVDGTGSTAVQSPPFIQIDYQITERCNARCAFCSCWKSKEVSDLPAEVWVQAAQRMQSLAPVEFACIGGGEPFLYPHLEEVVKGLSALDIHTVVVTNGSLLSEKKIQAILEAGVGHIDFSLDGFAATHDSLRGVDGLFQRCVTAMKRIKEIDVSASLGISTLICERNIRELPQFARWALDHLPVEAINFQAYNQVTSYRGPQWWHDDPLWPNDSAVVEEVLTALQTMARGGARIVNDPLQLDKFKRYFANPDQPLGIRCPAGTFNFSVSHTGDIHGCIAEAGGGNISKDDPVEIYRTKFGGIRQKAKQCTENCHFLINCYFPLHWKRWSELMGEMVEPEEEPCPPAPLRPGRLVLPPEVRGITSAGPHESHPDLIHLDGHLHLDLLGKNADPDRRLAPPGAAAHQVPLVYLCGDSSEVHRWGVGFAEDDFFDQVAALEQLASQGAIYHTVVGVRRTNFHRLDRIHDLIWKCRGMAGVPIESFDLGNLDELSSRFRIYLSQVNAQTLPEGIEFTVVDDQLEPLLDAVEKGAHLPDLDRRRLLRALGPVCKDVFTGPRYLLLDLAGKCNLDCVYCRRFSPWHQDYWEGRHPELSGFLDFTAIENVLADAKALGVETILLVGGGEPTLHPKFKQIIELIRHYGMSYNFSTNGSLLDTCRDVVLAGGCGAITVSLSFASEGSFSKIRPNSSQRLMSRIEDNIRGLTAAKRERGVEAPEVTALYAICKYNVDEITDMVHHAADLGVDTVWFQLVHLEEFSKQELSLDADEMERAKKELKSARALAQQKGITFNSFIDFELDHYDEEKGDWSSSGMLEQGCFVGWHFSFVHVRREVFMCCGAKVVGILDENGRGFKDLWSSEAYSRYRNDGLVMHRENPLTLYGNPLYEAYCDSCDNHDQNTMMLKDIRHFGLTRFVER